MLNGIVPPTNKCRTEWRKRKMKMLEHWNGIPAGSSRSFTARKIYVCWQFNIDWLVCQQYVYSRVHLDNWARVRACACRRRWQHRRASHHSKRLCHVLIVLFAPVFIPRQSTVVLIGCGGQWALHSQRPSESMWQQSLCHFLPCSFGTLPFSPEPDRSAVFIVLLCVQ